MSDIKQKLYDEIYDEDQKIKEPKGGLGVLYRYLSRFATSRYEFCKRILAHNTKWLIDIGCGDGHFLFIAKDISIKIMELMYLQKE